MTPEQFCYWLQGLVEIGKPEQLNKEQIQIIKEHLDLVFTKVTGDQTIIIRENSPCDIQIPNFPKTDIYC
jgi:hypothetical protein